MTISEFIAQRAKSDKAVAKLLSEMDSFQGRTATRMAGILGQLEVTGGRIVASPENMARLSQIIAELETGFVDPRWQKAVGDYLSTFTEFDIGLKDYMGSMGELDNALMTALRVQYQTVAGDYLLNAASFQRTLHQPIVEEVGSYIAGNARFQDAIKGVAEIITEGKDGKGAMIGNATTAVHDMVSIYERTATQTASEKVGAEFFLYQGKPIDTTREFCLAREGKYWHKKEVEAWGDLTWDGQIPGTNETTIFSLLGGYGCRHVLVPVAKRDVPNTDLERMRGKGLI